MQLAKVVNNGLLFHEGQTTWLITIFRPQRSIRDSMREGTPKNLSPTGYRRQGGKYFYMDGTKGMDMNPIYEIVRKALRDAKKR